QNHGLGTSASRKIDRLYSTATAARRLLHSFDRKDGSQIRWDDSLQYSPERRRPPRSGTASENRSEQSHGPIFCRCYVQETAMVHNQFLPAILSPHDAIPHQRA